MKNLSFPILLLLLACTIFDSCRKGDDDPLISFRTRTNRLQGQWNIVKGSEKYSHINSNNISITTISDDTYTKITSGSLTESGTIYMKYNFTKNGDYNFTRIETYGNLSDTITARGTWAFLNAHGNTKNKEAILLRQLSFTLSHNSIISKDLYSKNNVGTVWMITCLKNNYISFDSEVEHTSPNVYSEVLHYEFKQ